MKTVFFDMDGVLVEYNSALKHIDETTRKEYEGHYQDIPGFFSMMEPMPGAIEAVKSLSQHYEVFILSTAWNGASSFKGEWIKFGSGEFPNWESVVSYLQRKDHILPNKKI